MANNNNQSDNQPDMQYDKRPSHSRVPAVMGDEHTSNQMAVHDPHVNAYMPDDDEIDLRELWHIITKHKGLIFTITSLVLATTIIATLLMRPIYRAEALIEIKPDRKSVVKFDNLEQNNLQPLEYKNTQKNIISSASVAEAVIDKLGLANNAEINGEQGQRGLLEGVKQIVSSLIQAEEFEEETIDDISEQYKQIERFKTKLNVSEFKRSDLFKISFDSFDPKLAADVVNTVISEYVRLDRLRRLDSTSDAKKFLADEIAAIQAKLESSEKDLTDFARSHQIVDVEEKGNVMTQRLADLNSQLTNVTGERVAAEALWVQSQSQTGLDALPSVLSNDLITTFRQVQAKQQAEFFRLSKIYKPAYPELVQAKAQLDDTVFSIDREVRRIVAGLGTNYEQLVNKERLLSSKVEEQKQILLGLKDRSIQYNILKREWESNRQLYTGLLESMKEVGVAGGMEPNNISVIDQARIPVYQYKPNLQLNAALAGVLGMMGGIGIAFLLSFLDNTVRSPEDVEKMTGLASLGLVPKDKSAKANNPKDNEDTPIIEFRSHFDRKSEVAEAYRSIRTSLMFSSGAGMPQVIQLTSTQPSEGKTTTAINMALVLADNGAKVLIIDADMRKHRIHQVFRIPHSPGLSEAIVSGLELNLARKTPFDNVWVLPAGTTVPNPAEMIGSTGMDKLIDDARDHYDHIVIDSAPLLGLADSVILSTKVDGIAYVVNAGVVNKDHLREGVKRLRRVHAPVLGTILNNVDMSSKEYGYYGQYYYNYSAEEESKTT